MLLWEWCGNLLQKKAHQRAWHPMGTPWRFPESKDCPKSRLMGMDIVHRWWVVHSRLTPSTLITNQTYFCCFTLYTEINTDFGLVLEKNLEGSLDCKEIKPVNPKGNWPWIFIGRTDTEAPLFLSTWGWEKLKAKGEEGSRGWYV